MELIAKVILKHFGFAVRNTHCQITPGGFLLTNKFAFPCKHTIIKIALSEMLTERFSILIFPNSKMYICRDSECDGFSENCMVDFMVST